MVDFYLSETRDCEATKLFLKKAMANPDNRPPHVLERIPLKVVQLRCHQFASLPSVPFHVAVTPGTNAVAHVLDANRVRPTRRRAGTG